MTTHAMASYEKIFSLVVAVLLVVDVHAESSSTRIALENADLERGSVGWRLGEMPNWSVEKGAGRNGTVGLVWTGRDTSRYQVVGFPLPLACGKRYRVTVWAKDEGLSEGQPGVCVEWCDRDRGGYLGGVGSRLVPGAQADPKGWRQYEADTGFIPPDAVGNELHLYVPTEVTGRCVYDDVEVECLGDAPPQPVFCSAPNRRAEEGRVIFSVRTYPDFGKARYEDCRASFTVVTPEGPTEIACEDFRDGVVKMVVDVSRFAVGTHPVTYAVTTKSGERLVFGETSFTRLAQTTRPAGGVHSAGRVHFDAHQRLIVDGKPFFPLGVYWSDVERGKGWSDKPWRDGAERDPRQFRAIRGSPFNFVLSYNNRATARYLDEFHACGIKVICSLCVYHDIPKEFCYAGYRPPVKTQAEADAWIRAVVGEVKDHPATLGWYVYDEPKEAFMGTVSRRYAFVRELDRDHPCFTCVCDPRVAALALGTCDCQTIDCYPVPGHGDEKSVPADLAQVTWTLRNVSRTMFGLKPVWGIPQAYPHEPQRARFPTAHEQRSMAWQMIAAGANGLVFYSLGEMLYNQEKPGYSFDAAWKTTCATAADVKKWEKVLVSAEPSPELADVPPTLSARTWSLDGRDYLLVCNLVNRPVETAVTVCGRKVPVKLGGFDVDMRELWPK